MKMHNNEMFENATNVYRTKNYIMFIEQKIT